MQSKLKLPIFLDNQSTTQTDPEVINAMTECYKLPSNPHSRTHSYGWAAEAIVEDARSSIAKLIKAQPKDIVFTSGATESNNLAIKGVANFYRSEQKNHIVTVATEHKCVLEACRSLEDFGIEVTYLPVKQNGILDIQELKSAIKDSTILVSVMMANNEIGVIQPMEEIGEVCRAKNVFFHTDAAQAFGKIPIDVDSMGVSLMSISSHKIYGPMGVGALYVRRKNPRVRIKPIISGGGQERGMKSGTLPTPIICGFGKAAKIASDVMESDHQRIKKLSSLLYNGIKSGFPDIVLNGDPVKRIVGNLNISFPYVEGESIIMAIKDLAVSSGSACTSASLESSYVLRSIGVDEDLAHSSIRFGIGRFNTQEEIEYAKNLILSQIQRLREMSPLWEMVQEGVDLKSIKWSEH